MPSVRSSTTISSTASAQPSDQFVTWSVSSPEWRSGLPGLATSPVSPTASPPYRRCDWHSPQDAEKLADLHTDLGDYPDTVALLTRALVENPPVLIRDGGVIADGYDSELDELRNISKNAGDFLLEIEQREREATGLSSLKVGYNRVHGYYIEISKAQAASAPEAYVRRQTLKNAERFITPELKTFEDKALSSKSRALAREKHLYDMLVTTIGEDLVSLQGTAVALCDLDVLASFAERAQALDLVRPEFTEEPVLDIDAGRHPRRRTGQ